MVRVALAFYRGAGTLVDRAIRGATRSRFSHVELVDLDRLIETTRGAEGPTISASWRDGGVREATIAFTPEHWEWIPLQPWYRPDALDLARAEIGKGYDLAGILLSQVFNTRRQASDRWFCSELCGHALGLPESHTLAPGDLAWRAYDMNRAYEMGLAASP